MNRTYSGFSQADRGGQRGTIIRQLLFIKFINDLPESSNGLGGIISDNKKKNDTAYLAILK